MTREEIGKKYFQCNCGEIYLSRGLTAPDCPYHSLDWEAAMDECAKNVAIEFVKFSDEYKKDLDDFVHKNRPRFYTTEQLYSLFQEETQSKSSNNYD